jgi:Zn finger protein HypA/HybF involved in hydrogenase expression
MVEVVEHRKMELSCKKCKSRLAYDKSDIVEISVGANWGGETPERKKAIKCPVCDEYNLTQ